MPLSHKTAQFWPAALPRFAKEISLKLYYKWKSSSTIFCDRVRAVETTGISLVNCWLSNIVHSIFQFLDLDLFFPDLEGLPFDWSAFEWDGWDVEEEADVDGPAKSFDSSVTIFSKSSIFFSLDSNKVVISSSLSFHLWRFFLHWCIFRTRTTSFLWASDKSLHFIDGFDLELLLFGDDISNKDTRSVYCWSNRFQKMKQVK